jgi:hypothetical protein
MGRATSWLPLAGTKADPGHWDRCRGPMTWKIDFTGLLDQHGVSAPELRRWRSTFAAIAKATGYQFVYGGTGTYPPTPGADGRNVGLVNNEPGVDIVIAYGSSTDQKGYREPQFAGTSGMVGWGGPSWTTEPTVAGTTGLRYQHGNVLISAPFAVHYQDPFAARKAGAAGDQLRAVYLHEMGHVLGLAHVRDVQQMMYASVVSRVADRYGAGDQAGLRTMASMPCFLPAPPVTPTGT